ncbi:hypothetical protein [Okeania hirsuta]|uniref:hypothetical protein n=1 Tax=Okeania hirsuta TaxID=1458930 RepID=UPI001EFFDA99|nr:hypothetical protein [Okeania hirsuta]
MVEKKAKALISPPTTAKIFASGWFISVKIFRGRLYPKSGLEVTITEVAKKRSSRTGDSINSIVPSTVPLTIPFSLLKENPKVAALAAETAVKVVIAAPTAAI